MNIDEKINITLYDASQKASWDAFVDTSRQATFLFKRDYMDYHAHRFHDASLLIYKGNTLLALLPAHVDGERCVSHQGLTYGGFITHAGMGASLMLHVCGQVLHYMKSHLKAKEWIYAPIPHIYTTMPSQEDLYALWRMGATLMQRKVASVIEREHGASFSTLRRRKVKKAQSMQYTLSTQSDFKAFWSVLNDNLAVRHNARPVHSLEEIEMLHELFPHNIFLHVVTSSLFPHEILAGCVIYLSPRVAHVQYIASTEIGRVHGAVDWMFHELLTGIYKEVDYFDFGTSVEQGGRVLNEGLAFQKEGYGARTVVYDTYHINL